MVYESALMSLCVPKMCIDSSGQVSACASTNKKVLKKRTDGGHWSTQQGHVPSHTTPGQAATGPSSLAGGTLCQG